jgi:hypothetical protein
MRDDVKGDIRRWMTLVEAKGAQPPAYEVVRLNGPKNQSSRVIERTVIHATTKAELHAKIKAWMEQIGLDPDDEDDLSYVTFSNT